VPQESDIRDRGKRSEIHWLALEGTIKILPCKKLQLDKKGGRVKKSSVK